MRRRALQRRKRIRAGKSALKEHILASGVPRPISNFKKNTPLKKSLIKSTITNTTVKKRPLKKSTIKSTIMKTTLKKTTIKPKHPPKTKHPPKPKHPPKTKHPPKPFPSKAAPSK